MLENYKNMPILVTGGCGFIGSHIVEELVALQAKVTIIDNLSTGTIENIKNIINKVRFIEETITDPKACLLATRGQERIFHLAALISVADSIEKPEECHRTNVDGTFNILHAAHLNKVKRIVFSSSAAVYGNVEGLCTENTPCRPISPYGFSKRIGELCCQQYAHLFGLETVILRYFNVFGPRQNPQGPYAAVVAKFSEQMATNKQITIFGTGKQTRDFVAVEDVARANLTLGIHEAVRPGDTYNVASGNSISLLELVDRLRQQYPTFSGKISFAPARKSDIRDSRADCSKYFEVLEQFKEPELK